SLGAGRVVEQLVDDGLRQADGGGAAGSRRIGCVVMMMLVPKVLGERAAAVGRGSQVRARGWTGEGEGVAVRGGRRGWSRGCVGKGSEDGLLRRGERGRRRIRHGGRRGIRRDVQQSM